LLLAPLGGVSAVLSERFAALGAIVSPLPTLAPVCCAFTFALLLAVGPSCPARRTLFAPAALPAPGIGTTTP